MGSLEKCAIKVKKELGLKISVEDVEDYLHNLADKVGSDKFDPAQESALIEKAAEELSERRRLRMRLKAKDMLRLKENMNFIDEQASPYQALLAIVSGSSKVYEGGRKSIDYTTKAIVGRHEGYTRQMLEEFGISHEFASGKHDKDIAKEMWALSEGKATGGTKNKIAQDIAGILKSVQDDMINRANNAGAWIKKSPGYIVQQSHSMRRIARVSEDEWINDVTPLLSEDTFLGLKDLSREDFLKAIYEGRATGVHFAGSGKALIQVGGIAERLAHENALKFKSATDWFTYHEKYGHGDLRSSFFENIRHMAESISVMERLGSEPNKALRRLKVHGLSKIRAEAAQNPKSRAAKDLTELRKERGALENRLDIVTGKSRLAQHQGLADVGFIVRGWQTVTSLGGSTLSSIADLSTVLSELQWQGHNMATASAETLKSIFAGRGSKEQQYIANLIGIGNEGWIGSIVSRFDADDSPPGWVSKGLNTYFKLNLQNWWNDSRKSGVAYIMAHDMGSQIRSGNFRPETVRMLELYGIGEHERQLLLDYPLSTWKTELGRDVMTPDVFEEMPDSEFIDLFKLQGMEFNAEQFHERKMKLADNLRTMFLDRADFAVPTPGANERAIMLQGTQPGTPVGEALRFMFQFKAFPITYMTRVWGRETANGVVNGLPAIAKLIAMSTVMGYVAMSAKDIAKGKEPRTLEDPETWAEAMMQGGGLGLYGDFIFGKFAAYGRSPLDVVAGPTLGGAANIGMALHKLKAGNVKGLKTDAVNMLSRNIPGGNLFYIQAALNYMVVYQMKEIMNPGYLRRMESRMRQDKDQEFFFPPSQEIPSGGGNRLFEGLR